MKYWYHHIHKLDCRYLNRHTYFEEVTNLLNRHQTVTDQKTDSQDHQEEEAQLQRHRLRGWIRHGGPVPRSRQLWRLPARVRLQLLGRGQWGGGWGVAEHQEGEQKDVEGGQEVYREEVILPGDLMQFYVEFWNSVQITNTRKCLLIYWGFGLRTLYFTGNK